MKALTETWVRLFASAKSWIEGEAYRQFNAAAKLEHVDARLASVIATFRPLLTYKTRGNRRS